MAPKRQLGELYYDITARTDKLTREISGVERSFGKLTTFVLKNPVAAIAAVGTALLAVAAKAIAMANDVEKSMRRVQAVTAGGAQGIKQLRGEIEQLSRSTGRSQKELGEAAAIAAKSAGSTTEVGQRLRAALDLSQATGEDLTGILENLDTVLDVFGKSSEDSAESLATLFAAAKGRQPITELFAAIEASAPGIQRLGLDLNTTARALVTLGETLPTAKQASGELKALSEQGAAGRAEIERLAAQTKLAADPMRELADAARDANNSTDALNERIRSDFSATLIDLGNKLLPLVNSGLRSLVDTIEILTGQVKPIAAQGVLATVQNLGPLVERLEEQGQKGAKGLRDLVKASQDLAKSLRSNDLKLTNLNVGELERLGTALRAMVGSERISDTTKSFLEPILTAVEKLIAEAPKAAAAVKSIDGGGLPSDRIKQGKKDAEQAEKDRESAIERANKGLDVLRRKAEDAQQASGEFALLQAEGFKQLATAVGDTVALLDLELSDLRRQFVEVGRAAGKSDEEIEAAFTDASAHLRAARDAATAMNGALARITIPPELQAKLAGPFTQIRADLEKTRKALKELGLASSEIDDIIKDEEIKRVQALLKSLGLSEEQIKRLTGPLKDVKDSALSVAEAIQAIGNAVISVLGAVGALDQRLQDVGRGLVNISAGIAQIGEGKFLQGGLGVVGGVADLVKGLVGGSPEEKAAREAELQGQKDLVRALDRVRESIGDLAQFGSSGADLSRVRNVPLTFQRSTGRDDITGEDIFETLPRSVDQVLADLRRVGVGLDDLRQLAADAGVTLSDSPTISELQRLQRVLQEIDFGAFTDTFAGRLSSLQQRFELFGDAFDEPTERFAAFVKLLNDPKVGAPALFGILDGLDTATEEGREAAQKILQNLFEQLDAGLITPEMLNGLSVDQFREALSRLNQELAEGTSAADARAEIFNAANERIGLEDIGDPLEQFGVQVDAIKEAFPAIADALGAFDFSSVEGIQAFGDAVPGLIAGLRDGSIVMEGMTDESLAALIAALLDLETAGDAAETAINSLADQLSQAFSDIDLDAAIFGGSDSETLNKKFSSVGLGDFDLSSQAGRDAAREALRGLATADPSLKPLIANLIRELDALQELPGAVGDAVAATTGGGDGSSIASARQPDG
jgi:methyl-accepting chemotaxis protein